MDGLTRHKSLRQKEVHLYGSSRLGVAERRSDKTTYLLLSEIRVQEVENPFVAGNISGIFVAKIGGVAYTVPEENRFISRLGIKRYELVNPLGNVQAVISDRALPVRVSPQIPAVSHYTADLLSATDYRDTDATPNTNRPGRIFEINAPVEQNGKKVNATYRYTDENPSKQK